MSDKHPYEDCKTCKHRDKPNTCPCEVVEEGEIPDEVIERIRLSLN